MQSPGYEAVPASTAEVFSGAPSAEIHDGLTVQLVPASLGRRIIAFFIDVGIVSSAMYLVLVLLGLALAFVGMAASSWIASLDEGSGNVVGAVLLALLLLVFLLVLAAPFHAFFIYFEHKKGATPGKKIFGLKVVSADGKRLTLKQCVYRDLMRWYVDVTLVVPGLIAILSSRKNQRLGDMLAGTMVVHSAQSEAKSNFMYITQQQYQLLCESISPKTIPPHLCEQYLSFAFPEYVSYSRRATSEERSTWEERARRFLPGSDAMGLDQETVLLFFAEHCFQLANQSH